jgi:hypothetical protein
MAEIVKKIGRITKYETKEYVGSTRMLDLDRSARAATPDRFDADPPERLGTEPHLEDEADSDEEYRDPETEFDSDVTTQLQLAENLRHKEEQAAGQQPAGDSNADDSQSEPHDEQRVP